MAAQQRTSPTQPYFSEEDLDGYGHLDAQQDRKRSSRACDQCRKTKSKCERSSPDDDNTPCKTCIANNTQCTFLGPSYKRGPPKGYIHAIEQRWHHVEAVLGAILSSRDPRAQALVTDLRKDDLAREILNRVDVGPFGPTFRSRNSGRDEHGYFAPALAGSKDLGGGREGRARRQSRVSREIVSQNQDLDPLPEPTMEWQDRLASRIGSGSGHTSSSSSTTNGHPAAQRRRLEGPEWDNMYTLEGSSDTSAEPEDEVDGGDGEDNVTAMGHLSLDENREVRFHGKASGLHLLRNRTDNRKEGGLWNMPDAGVWPPSTIRPARLIREEDIEINLPPMADQDRLLQLYFTYVHPGFPVIHKGKFMEEWEAQRNGSPIMNEHPQRRAGSPYSSQVSKALLLAMFALAARYLEQPPEGQDARHGMMWEIGCNYAIDSREILNKIYHHSRISTCQALLLLGMHEFGIGQTEHAWMFIGMALRMAEDLGLNRASDQWQYDGQDLFTPDEKQLRKQVWWGCFTGDIFTAIYLGRPVSVGESDFDTALPDIPESDNEIWEPHVMEPFTAKYQPAPGRIIACFRQSLRVVKILSDIVKQIYPVVYRSRTPKRVKLNDLEQRLDSWYIELPEELRYESTSKRPVPPPHIMVLHVRYWSAVLLLHRAFMPKMNNSMAPRGSGDHDTIVLKSFDLCQSAATHISSIVSQYDEHFGMKRSPLFLASYILSAAIMHIVTLNLRQNNIQATLGLRQCLVALEKMETIWPSASRFKDLLNGANMQFQGVITPLANAPDRSKRPAEDQDMAADKTSDILQREAFGGFEKLPTPPGAGAEDTRMMARMLGLDVPGIQASTSYFPGYEWWPSIQIQQQQPSALPAPMQVSQTPQTRPIISLRPGAASQPGSQQSSPVAPAPDWMSTISNPASSYAYGMNTLPNYSYDNRRYE